jgi:hypothetical protein
MPLQDDIYVIEDQNILSVEEKQRTRDRKLRTIPSPPPRRRTPDSGATQPVSQAMPRETGSSRPVVAASLSMLVCGAGQVFNGQRQLGLLFFLVEAMMVAIHWSAAHMWGFLQEMGYLFEVSEERMLAALIGADALFLAFVLGNVAQAYWQAGRDHEPFRGLGRPAFSAVASLLVPGWGQILNAQLGKGLVFLFCVLGGIYAAAAMFVSPFVEYIQNANLIGVLTPQATQTLAGAVFLGGLIWVVSIYDAFIVARYHGRCA